MFFIFLLPCICQGYNILISTPNAVRSELNIIFAISSGLLDAGHNVTLITAHQWPKRHRNLNHLWIPEVVGIKGVLSEIEEWEYSAFFNEFPLFIESQNIIFWEDSRVMDVWKKRCGFDLFLTTSFYAEGSFPFLMDNDIPFVQVITSGPESLSLFRDANLVSPSILPSLMTKYNEIMTFWERSVNLVDTVRFHYDQHKAARIYTGKLSNLFPDFGDYIRYYDRVSLTFINGHFALDGAVPLLPNQVEIGTIHCRKPIPLEKVDKDLAAFVEGAGEAGIIYFSIGSIAKSSHLPQETKETLLEAFRRIPQRVLWKYEEENIVLPPNVFIRQWMPQQDILGHPKTKVFISHCGNFGSQEAKYHGVPVLGFPIGFDQPRTCSIMLRKGLALILDWNDLTVEKIVHSLNVLINDTTYMERMKKISKILQDQKETPMERAIWWLEYVIRHNGAPHLQYAGKRMSVFQYVMLDVVLFWLAVSVLLIFSLVIIVRFICWGKRGTGITDGLLQNKQKDKKKK